MIKRVDECIKKFLEGLEEDIVLRLYNNISSGKKLRAKLILRIVSDVNEDAITLAAIVEMIHSASLLHDDVIDEADIRRGKRTINTLFGDKTAIMLGDILYSKAFYELSSMDKVVAQTISDAVAKLSIGELLDVELSKNFNDNEKKYFDMIYKKTAVLIEAASSSAAYLAGYDQKKFAIYGKNLGLAFQIIDDILDITSDNETLGKPSMHDFKEGKTTLPYIYLHNVLDKKDKGRLLSYFKKDIAKEDKAWIKIKMQDSGALEKTLDVVKKLSNEALVAISEYKNSELEKIIKDMVQREY